VSPIQNLANHPDEANESFPSNTSFSEIILAIGALISLILLFRFIFNLIKISRLISENERVRKPGFTMVKIRKNISPFSFLNYLFVSKDEVENEKIRSEILYHEFAHIRQ